MSGERGPTTEELRARVLAYERDAAKQLAWCEFMEETERDVFPDARPRSEVVVAVEPPLDKEKGERLGSPTRDERPADYT